MGTTRSRRPLRVRMRRVSASRWASSETISLAKTGKLASKPSALTASGDLISSRLDTRNVCLASPPKPKSSRVSPAKPPASSGRLSLPRNLLHFREEDHFREPTRTHRLQSSWLRYSRVLPRRHPNSRTRYERTNFLVPAYSSRHNLPPRS